VTIPDGVTSICNNAFWGCENLTVTYKGKEYSYDNFDEFYAAVNGG